MLDEAGNGIKMTDINSRTTTLRSKSSKSQRRTTDTNDFFRSLQTELRNKVPVKVNGKQLKLPAYEVALNSVEDRTLVKLALSLKLSVDNASRSVLINGQPLALECLRDAAKIILAEELHSAASV